MQSRRNPTRPLLLAAALGLPLPSLAAVVHVKATASGSANGSSWANATSLQAALAAAQPGDQLWVAKGVHKPAPAGNPAVSFVIPDGVAVYGGFAGTESSLAQRDWQANPTVLSGDIDGNDAVDADGVTTQRMGHNSHHVVRTGVVSSTTRLDGFTISAGNGGATSLQNWQQASNGGGWLNEGGTPSLRRLRFVQNVARNGGGLYTTAALSLEDIEFRSNGVWQDGGGAFFTGTGNHRLKKVRFNDNLAYTGSGGGMRCAQSNLTLLDSDFRGNTAPQQSGGGFSGQTCPAIMLRASFVENSAGGHSIFDHGGGGIHQLDGTLLLSEVRLQENHASRGDGGGLMARAPDVLVEKSLLLGNKASGSGGGASVAAYNAILRSSAVRGNVSGGDACYAQQTGNGWEPCYLGQGGGGGISLEGGNTTLVNMLVSGNVAPNGGGIRNLAGIQKETRIINSTFTGNYAAPSWDPAADPEWTGKGGGIWNGDGRTFIHNSIFWNNQDRTGVGTHRASVDNADIPPINPDVGGVPNQGNGFQEVVVTDSLVQGCKLDGIWPSPWESGWPCGADGGGNLTDIDPQFVAETPVGNVEGTLSGDARLKLGSPVLNKGNNLLIPAGYTTDLDGNPRIAAAIVDLGAYELPTCANRVVHVTTSGAGLRDGSSWANASDSLQYALSVAFRAQCQVWVAKGTYRPSPIGDRQASFRLRNQLAVFGGFAGNETQLTQRNWIANPTILSGDIGVAGDDSDNSLHVVRADSVGISATLDGFTIEKGRANLATPTQDAYGAGVLMNSSSATLRNLLIRHNLADGFGGGLYKTGAGQPLLENIGFESNSAGTKGGGMHSDNGNATLRRVAFTGNIANLDGGGLSAFSGDVSGSQLRFAGNTAGGNGGGLLYAALGKLTNVELSGNFAGARGGGVYTQGTLTLTNASIAGNRASTGNGGVRQAGGSLLLQNSFVWNNREAGTTGSAGASIGQAGGTTVRFSMLQGCKPVAAWNGACGSDGGWNLPDANPLLVVPLAPALAPSVAGDHRLQAASPLRNKGDNAALPPDLTTDLGGLPRIVGGLVDHGAHEVQ